MLRLPELEVIIATSLTEALTRLAAGPAARPILGGTDLVANLKTGHTKAQTLVAIGQLPELQGVDASGDVVRIGAAVHQAELARDPDILELFPALAYAVGRIASPQIRNAGTLGGNLCLDTRCRFINQSDLWREALGGCLKSHGKECHVIPGGGGCVAALSADSVPILMVLGAEAEIARVQDGALVTRRTPIADLYDSDGRRHVRIADGELLVAVHVPKLPHGARAVYRKWAVRQSIDFPLVSVAVRLDLDDAGKLKQGKVAIGVLGPRPRLLALDRWAGRTLDEDLAKQVAQYVFDRSHPLPNVLYDHEYRRERLRVEVLRALRTWYAPAAVGGAGR
ncbi:MAG: FAD binding domain-containing protein [Deltaproteobacteria bacterium]|nr:FAD binding domain-containing protein [Deltaproteobacteria bacterium]